jgi:predicted Zn-dependent protease
MRSCIAPLTLALFTACAGVGQESWLISEQDEIAMGRKFHAELLAEMPAWAGDPRVSAYVTAIGESIVPDTDRPDLAYTFTVVDTDELNAFAVPGGFVYVTAGLLKAAGSGAEVATVIAHELGHISARHGVQALERQILEQGLVDLLGGGGDLGPIVQGALQLGTGLVFDQDQEYEADALGVQYATAAGFNAWGIVDFFDYLRTLEGATPSDPVSDVFSSLGELFSTHPPTPDRILRVEGHLGRLGVERTSQGYAWEGDPAFATIAPLL